MLVYRDVVGILRVAHDWLRENFVWTPDAEVYRAVERWGLPVRQHGKLYDDCDGWAFMALRLWADAGIPLDSIYPACCAVERNPFDHCVAVAETDQGPVVSCCNQTHLRFRSALPYRGWIRPGNGGRAPIDQPWEEF